MHEIRKKLLDKMRGELLRAREQVQHAQNMAAEANAQIEENACAAEEYEKILALLDPQGQKEEAVVASGKTRCPSCHGTDTIDMSLEGATVLMIYCNECRQNISIV